MELNANFNERCSVHAKDNPWVPSPIKGVDRKMLDRLGDEVARATSIVRYAPESHFSPHIHTGGEEFLVLEGVFQDEHGDFPVGSYIRNPPETSHTPGSKEGCTIFVKLWQFDLADREQVRIDTGSADFAKDVNRNHVHVLNLFEDDKEAVSLEIWEAGCEIVLDAADGMEILVLEGSFIEAGETFDKHSWLRLPNGSTSQAIAGSTGTRVWIKRNHLRLPPRPPAVIS